MAGGWERFYRTAYTKGLGQRLRRIREGRHLTQGQVGNQMKRPNGARYSQGVISRVEAGYANSPLYVYLHLAAAYELDPARMLGPEDGERLIGEGELTLVLSLRRLGIAPDEAIARLATGGGRDQTGA